MLQPYLQDQPLLLPSNTDILIPEQYSGSKVNKVIDEIDLIIRYSSYSASVQMSREVGRINSEKNEGKPHINQKIG